MPRRKICSREFLCESACDKVRSEEPCYHPGVDLADCKNPGGTACGTACGGCAACGTACGGCAACGTACGGCAACGTACGGCAACGTACGACAACGTSGRRLRASGRPKPSPFVPRVRDLQLNLPAVPGVPGTPKTLQDKEGIAGIALNSVLFVHEHPGEGMTWILDTFLAIHTQMGASCVRLVCLCPRATGGSAAEGPLGQPRAPRCRLDGPWMARSMAITMGGL
eukprot:s1590_g1.t1